LCEAYMRQGGAVHAHHAPLSFCILFYNVNLCACRSSLQAHIRAAETPEGTEAPFRLKKRVQKETCECHTSRPTAAASYKPPRQDSFISISNIH
jgi:hypothetical protein